MSTCYTSGRRIFRQESLDYRGWLSRDRRDRAGSLSSCTLNCYSELCNMRANKMLLYGNSCKGSTVWNPFLNGVTCPPTVRYPQPPCPTETLFIGWNPPGTAHFWNSKKDKLRNSLAEVLWHLDWDRQGDFIQQF